MNQKDYVNLGQAILEMSQEYFFQESFKQLYPKKSEQELTEFWNKSIPTETGCIQDVIKDIEEGFLQGLTGVINPKFMGYILTRPVPESHLLDTLVNATHATPGATHLAMSATLIERCTIRWISQETHLKNFNGLYTSCGSISNLVALKCARDKKANRNRGIQSNIILYVSDETHYSIFRAWDILGCGIGNVRQYRNDNLEDLKLLIQKDLDKGYVPAAIVCHIGTTNTGKIEALAPIKNIAHEYGLWLHIDGAYGAAVLLLDEFQHLRKSAKQADSINIDLHKWFGMPAGTSIIYLNNKHSFIESFQFSADFIDFQNMNCDLMDQCQMGIEGTRRFYGLRVYAALKLIGFNEIKKRIKNSLNLAKLLENELKICSKIKVINSVDLSVVNFTIIGYTNFQLQELAYELYQKNIAFLTYTTCNEVGCLRCAIVNYETTENDIYNLVSSIRTKIE